MTSQNDTIDFITGKLKNEIDMLELGIWNRDNEKRSMKNRIQDMEEITMANLKEITVLKHSVDILEGMKE